MVLSAVLSMFIDSITVILFLAAITIELSQMLKFNPVYMILPEIFCANLGGSSTMSGDPPNIIIGTSLGLSFTDFLCNTGIIALVSLIAMLVYFYICFGKKLKGEAQAIDSASMEDPRNAITNMPGFIIDTVIFLFIVFLLVTHAQTGITVASIGAIAGVLTLVTSVDGTLLKKVDWNTILFFVGLFVVVGGLEETHILDAIATLINKLSGGNVAIMCAVILWFSAIASAVIDNIPFAATMIPVIKALSVSMGVPIETLAWTLALGTDIGGNATPIGASANVVGTSIAEKNGHHITWGTYCKYAIPATVITLLIGNIMIYFIYIA
jgi:Na+/H+ antiporter NhaD/arsenite permease-like protein